MKKFTASELVEQALELANMSNTDFLTHKELINYINDAFLQIYTEAINSGDLYWLETAIGTRTSGGNGYTDYQLPYDFFTMRKLTTSDGQNIARKSPSSNYGLSYDIINNKLRVYGMSNGVRMEYFPNPPYITFPDKQKDIDLTGEINASSLYGNYLVYTNDESLIVYDIANKTNIVEAPIDEDVAIKKIIAGRNQYAIQIENEDESVWVVNSYNTDNPNLIFTNLAIDEDGNFFEGTKEDFSVVFRKQEDEVTAYTFDDYIAFDINNETIVSEIKGNDFSFAETDSPFSVRTIVDNNIVTIKLMPDGTFEYEKTPIQGKPISLISPTGLVVYDGGYFIQDGTTETTFNYPNNIFYRAIAASLAMSFALKQGAEMETLGALLAGYLNQLKQLFESDASYNRIQNVY